MEWSILVSQIKNDDEVGLEHLYKFLSRGIRTYLLRQIGPENLEDKVDETFLIVVDAIRRGDLHEPERLMGFVRTVVRRQVGAYIEHSVPNRPEQADLEMGVTVADRRQNLEQEAIIRQKSELMRTALMALNERDRDILVRFYLKEQSQEQICREMHLTDLQFRLIKSRAKARLGVIAKGKLGSSGIFSVLVRAQVGEGGVDKSPSRPEVEPDPRVSSLIEDPIVQVLMAASAAFQRVETGRSWLCTPNQSLDNVAPITMISTELGRAKVINELGLVEHGMF